MVVTARLIARSVEKVHARSTNTNVLEGAGGRLLRLYDSYDAIAHHCTRRGLLGAQRPPNNSVEGARSTLVSESSQDGALLALC